jgi:hypothetical protein
MNKKIPAEKIQLNEEEFRRGAKKAKAFETVTNNIVKRESRKLIREISHQRGEAWSALSNQVVGSEHF